jgi:mono/diheme cytochrome c family protein
MIRVTKRLSGSGAACVALAILVQASAGAQTTGVEFFERNIRPLLAQRCLGCHAAVDHPAGSLRLDNRESLLQGGSRGPAIVAGKPEESLLIRAVRQTSANLRMPPAGKLSDAEIAALAQWIAIGAPWAGKRAPGGEKDPQKFWAFTPPKDPAIPEVKNTSWVKSPIDAFVLAGLEAKELKPAHPAGKRELIRRATFDLAFHQCPKKSRLS